MPSPAQRSLLFLDVDGPLIPFGADAYPVYQTGDDSNPLLTRLNPALGALLTALPCDLVWATTWMTEANDCVAPRIGLPPLPVVGRPEEPDEEERDTRNGLHWKTRALVRWAAGRTFAWVDDEITDADRSWVAAHHPGRALLHRVDPRQGLTDADFAVLGEWLRAS
ncbi:HAD domain-containing protein [Streptomyces sp. NBC_01537]|uniref:HAD domain-containing protein n=1 Tax=Streptomyces sp. NBC_01537 TaxID=2903896 RepID=UPI00386CEF51